MQSARTILSPTKQNQAPSNSPTKRNLNQILAYLKSQNIKLPNNLLKNPEDSFNLKLNPIQSLQQASKSSTNISNSQLNELKNLRIKLNDTQFELKKLQEDFAQYKRTVKLQKQRQIKKLQENFQKLKQNSKQNSQDFDYEKQKIIQRYQLQIDKLKEQYSKKIEKGDKQHQHRYHKQINGLKQLHQKQLKQIQAQNDKKYHNLQSQYTKQISNLKSQHEKQKHSISLRLKQKYQARQKQHQSIYMGLQSQKKTEQKLHQKTKIQNQKQKQILYTELCYQKNIKKNLQEQLIQKNKQIKQLKNMIEDMKITLDIIKDNAINQKKCMQQQHMKQIQQINQNFNQKITEILKSQIQQCNKYDHKIQKMQILHQQSQKHYQAKLQKLAEKFELRQSKKQDLEQIKKLTQTIMKRDEQIKKLTRQLRYRNLQIQNKQQVYNKIFKSSAKIRQDKRILASINKQQYPLPQKLERDSWSKQSLVRKSQTQDVKVFLNNMFKTKRQKFGTCEEV